MKRENIKLIIGIIVGGIIFGSIAVYASFIVNSNNVIYEPEDESWNVDSVDDALNELNTKANKYTNATFYQFGLANINSEMDINKMSKNVFIKYQNGKRQLVIYKDGSYASFTPNNYVHEYSHLIQVFGSSNCTPDSTGISCSTSAFICRVDSSGYIHCIDYIKHGSCIITSNDSASCSNT